ncbi:MAG: hypothetical protein VX367_02230 [SAR324 cluster bacterium]|nr:hypothetical protein [SAR324 cluster bacterium]
MSQTTPSNTDFGDLDADADDEADANVEAEIGKSPTEAMYVIDDEADDAVPPAISKESTSG